ncbi:hypothetical protein CPB86DRAFT_778254 [Serendipita vermifera]|nr:hypothetical protein CPB86DRAFT_778254 [Serendipita vermifera]
MRRKTFDSLPQELLMSISAHLDLKDLVHLAQVNRSIRLLSKLSKTFWLRAIIRQGTVLPLPKHLSLDSLTAEELGFKVHKAVTRDRNISGENAKLRSYTKITWPFVLDNGGQHDATVEFESIFGREERPLQASAMHLMHPNGEWLFLFSSTHVMRILHLRTGKLACEQRMSGMGWNQRGLIQGAPYGTFAVDFRGDSEVILVEIYSWAPSTQDEWDSNQTYAPHSTHLRVWLISLLPETGRITSKILNSKPIQYLPSHLSISGDYVVLVEDTSEDYDDDLSDMILGRIRLLNWKTGEFIHLPNELLPTAAVSTFPEYFISVGLSQSGGCHLQIVAFSYSQTEDSVDSDPEIGFVLASDIRLLARVPTGPDLRPVICHNYIGRQRNHLSIWIREYDWIPAWLIFDFHLGLHNQPQNWLVPLNDIVKDNPEGYSALFPRRIVDGYMSTHWGVPFADGRRFISITGIKNPHNEFKVLISVYKTDDTLSLQDIPGFERASDAREYHGKQCDRYQKSRFESPISYTADEDNMIPGVNSFAFEEWSGTAVVLMTNGDIWALRYGHP